MNNDDDDGGMEFLDCHHHFYDTGSNSFQTFLSQFIPNATYLPEDYDRDVVQPINNREESSSQVLSRKGIKHIGSVHVESMPDDGIQEVLWVESLQHTVKAYVASCDLTQENVDDVLGELKKRSSKARGIRWILDCVGSRSEPGNEATHAGNLRHDGIDYLRSGEGAVVVPEFERGFALLEKHGLTFDLQCAPEQLPAAAELCARYPNIPVVIDHMGKPMQILGQNNANMMPDPVLLEEWRIGMQAMAKNPNVYVKISMLGWIIPGWIQSARRIDMIKKLCQEVVTMFGPKRCMIATNWFKDAIHADSDGIGTVGPSAVDFLEYMVDFFSGLTPEEQRRLFAGTAKEFYRL